MSNLNNLNIPNAFSIHVKSYFIFSRAIFPQSEAHLAEKEVIVITGMTHVSGNNQQINK